MATLDRSRPLLDRLLAIAGRRRTSCRTCRLIWAMRPRWQPRSTTASGARRSRP
jgi:hypothetical protein